jgi:hypothetical protein
MRISIALVLSICCGRASHGSDDPVAGLLCLSSKQSIRSPNRMHELSYKLLTIMLLAVCFY